MLIRGSALSSDAADRVADRQTVPHAIDTGMVLICVILHNALGLLAGYWRGRYEAGSGIAHAAAIFLQVRQ